MDKQTDLEEQQNLEQLAVELDYEALRAGKKKLDDLTVPDLRAVHAYEGWKDGMEWEDVMALWLGTNDLYSSRDEILNQLVNVYGY